MTTPTARTAARLWPWLHSLATAAIPATLTGQAGAGVFLTGLELINAQSGVLPLLNGAR
ncbi:hypothetical protein [Amycolatopsis methanolica]|uniref:hypothetical protein n=1 Tax=Amycolatopsis methanolica TaxID=1814 RepID=UPI0003700D61|nr:hypothetical protein [Amycolatopsis methanolica]